MGEPASHALISAERPSQSWRPITSKSASYSTSFCTLLASCRRIYCCLNRSWSITSCRHWRLPAAAAAIRAVFPSVLIRLYSSFANSIADCTFSRTPPSARISFACRLSSLLSGSGTAPFARYSVRLPCGALFFRECPEDLVRLRELRALLLFAQSLFPQLIWQRTLVQFNYRYREAHTLLSATELTGSAPPSRPTSRQFSP